ENVGLDPFVLGVDGRIHAAMDLLVDSWESVSKPSFDSCLGGIAPRTVHDETTVLNQDTKPFAAREEGQVRNGSLVQVLREFHDGPMNRAQAGGSVEEVLKGTTVHQRFHLVLGLDAELL